MRDRWFVRGMLGAACVAVAGCSVTRPIVVAPFRLEANQGESQRSLGEQPGVFPLSAGERSMPATGRPGPTGAGVMRVAIDGILRTVASQRRLLATSADVDSIKVSLYEQDGAANPVNFVPQVASLTRAQIQAGQREIVFANLPYTWYSIWVEALDAQGASLGINQTGALLVDANPVIVNVDVRLKPTVLAPLPSTGGSSGGAGGTPPSPSPTPTADGTLALRVSLRDGFPVTGLRELGSFTIPDGTSYLSAPGGRLALFAQGTNTLMVVDKLGTAIWSQTLGTDAGLRLAGFYPNGDALLRSPTETYRLDPTGTKTPFATPLATSDRVVFDGRGTLWSADVSTLRRHTPSGQADLTLPMPDIQAWVGDATGGLWMVRGSVLEHRDGQGQLTCSYDLRQISNPIHINSLVLHRAGGVLVYSSAVVNATPQRRLDTFDAQAQPVYGLHEFVAEGVFTWPLGLGPNDTQWFSYSDDETGYQVLKRWDPSVGPAWFTQASENEADVFFDDARNIWSYDHYSRRMTVCESPR